MPETSTPAPSSNGNNRDITFAERIFWFCLIIAGAALVHGYRFAFSDSCNHLPIAFRLFDPDYLATDWYTNASAGFTFRTPFALLVGGLAQVVGWPAAYLIVHLATWYALYDGILRIARLTTGSSRAGIVAVVVAVLFLTNETLSKVFYTTPIPRKVSQAIALYGFYSWLRGRWIVGGVLFGIAANFHLFTAGEGAALAAGALVVDGMRRRRVPWDLWKGLAACALTAAPMLVGIAMMSASGGGETELASFIAGRVRDAHHTLPHAMPFGRYLTHVVELSVAAYVWSRMRTDGDQRAWERLGTMLVVTVTAMALSAVLVEFTSLPLITTFTVFLNSFWLRVGAAIGIGLLFERLLSGRERRGGSIAAAALFIAGGLVTHVLLTHPSIVIMKLMPAVPVFAAILLWVAVPAAGVWTGRHGRVLAVAGVAVLALAFGLPHALRGVDFPDHSVGDKVRTLLIQRVSVTETPEEPGEEELLSWIRENTPRDAVFVIPPEIECFRVHTGRSAVYNWKSVPYRVDAIIDWFHRGQRAADYHEPPERWPKGPEAREFVIDRYRQLPETKVLAFARDYGATYVVTTFDGPETGLSPVFTGIDYRVYEVPLAPAAE